MTKKSLVRLGECVLSELEKNLGCGINLFVCVALILRDILMLGPSSILPVRWVPHMYPTPFQNSLVNPTTNEMVLW